MLRKIIKIVAIALVVLGIAAFFLRDSRLAAHIRFADNAHVPRVNADYTKLARVIPPKSASVVEVFSGLPHNFSDDEEFVHELWNSDNQSIHGYRFYSKPVALTESFKKALHDVITDSKSFEQYLGPKLCGGYHADFAVHFDDKGDEYWFLVCLGCSEVLCFSEKAELICELEPAAYKELLDAWRIERQRERQNPASKLPE